MTFSPKESLGKLFGEGKQKTTNVYSQIDSL